MAVTVYKSTDASAPVLTGVAGSLITVLDAILVNGYGAKAAAGWTKPFSGTNLAVYRNATTGGTGLYLNVDDAAADANFLGREARIRGFETKTGTDTGATVSGGTNAFPTSTQAATSIIVKKSRSGDATARSWICVADQRTLYFFSQPGHFVGYSAFMFGDYFSLGGTGDAYRAICVGRVTTGSNLDTIDSLEFLAPITGTTALTAAPGHFVPRYAFETLTTANLAYQVSKHGNGAHSLANLVGLATYPNYQDNSLLLERVTIHAVVGGAAAGSRVFILGRMRGFWHFLHPVGSAIADGDTFAGTGLLTGKTFIVIKPTASGAGIYILETSDTWETN